MAYTVCSPSTLDSANRARYCDRHDMDCQRCLVNKRFCQRITQHLQFLAERRTVFKESEVFALRESLLVGDGQTRN